MFSLTAGFGNPMPNLFQNISTDVVYKKWDENCIYFGRYVWKHNIFAFMQKPASLMS